MFSFITLSRDPKKVRGLRSNLEAFFGNPDTPEWDLLVMDGTQYDLFTGYNAGAQQTTEELLVFLHDDVRLLGRAAGLADLLSLSRRLMTGWIGVAGSRVMPDTGCWWQAPHHELRGAVHHPCPVTPSEPFGMHLNVWPHQGARFGTVAVLDGVFLMIHRRQFVRIGGFNEKQFQGFHFYDMDATFRATRAGLTNYAAPLPIFHGSPGAIDSGWETNRLKFLDLYHPNLPYTLQE